MSEKVCCKGHNNTHCEYDGIWICKNPDCIEKVITSTLPGAYPAGCQKIDTWNSRKARDSNE